MCYFNPRNLIQGTSFEKPSLSHFSQKNPVCSKIDSLKCLNVFCEYYSFRVIRHYSTSWLPYTHLFGPFIIIITNLLRKK